MAENESGARVPFETRIKESFSLEWTKADTPDKKKSLLQRILKIIKDMVANADTAVNEAEKAKSGVIPRSAKEAKEAAAQPVIEFLQFLTGNNGQPLDIEALQSLGLNDTQQTFIQTLANKTQSADSATFLANIINKATDKDNPQYLTVSKPGEQKTQLEKDFDMVRLNPVAADSMRESMLKLSEKGKIKDTQGNVLTVADVDQKFQTTRQSEEQQKTSNNEKTEENEEQYNLPQNPMEMRGGNRKKRGVEDENRISQYKEIMDKLRNGDTNRFQELNAELDANRLQIRAIEQNEQLSKEARKAQIDGLSSTQDEKSEELRQLTDEVNGALNYLLTGEFPGEPFADETAVKNFIKDRLKINSDYELEKVQRFMQEGTGTLDGSYEGYQDLAAKVNRDYTVEAIRSKIIINGRIDIDAVKKLQAEIEDDLGVLFETLYNSPKGSFEESFSSYSEGQMLRKITQHLRVQLNRILNEEPDQKKRSKFKEIFNDMIISPIQRRPALERIVHQYQQVGATIDLEKLRDILKTYNITSLQEFYNDDLTATINDLMPSFIQYLFVQNGNDMINNFFQLVQEEESIDKDLIFDVDKNVNNKENKKDRKSKKFVLKYREQCIDYMYEVINQVHKAKGNTDEISKDRINARFSRAYLDNFLLTLRGIKVMSKANPMFEKFGDLPFDKLITGIFNPLAGWGKFGHRGRGHQESGDAETTEFSGMNNFSFNEIALHDFIKKYGDTFDNFHPAQMKKEGDKRVMYRIFPGNKQLMEDLRTGRWDAYYTMDEVYKGMVFGNVIDQAGWPFAGFNNKTIKRLSLDYMKDENGNGIEYGNLTRKQKLELKYKTSGVVTAFWDVEGFANEDTANMFVQHLFDEKVRAIDKEKHLRDAETKKGRPLTQEEKNDVIRAEIMKIKDGEFNNMDWLKKMGEYTKEDKRFDKIFDVKIEGKDTKVAFREYRMHRINSLKGEVFHQLLLKDPNAWLAEMVQTYPELSEGTVSYKDNNGESKSATASEFYFNLSTIPDTDISEDDKVKRDRFRFKILTKFRGKEESDYLSNVPHLKKIMDFYTNLYDKVGSKADKDKTPKEFALLQLSTDLSIARQRAVQNNEAQIKDEYVTDDTIRNMMFGADGLISYFDNMVGGDDTEKRKKYFGDGEQDLGEVNGFYQRWSFSKEQDNQSTILPEGDTNMKYLLEDNENPQALDRRLGTDMAFVKAQEVLNKVPGVCKKAGDAKDIDGWFGVIEELHKEMTVIADEDQAKEQKYQQLLYQTICNWFSMDSDVEKFFTGAFAQMKLGTDVAMATLKSNNMSKFLLDQDLRRQYLILLLDKSYIKSSNYDAIGGWGFSTAEMVAGVNLGEILSKQVAYAIAGALLVTVVTAIKEGYEEEVEEE